MLRAPPAERCAQDASFRLENSLVFGKKVHHEIPGVQYRFGENRAKFAGLLRVDDAGLWPKSAATQNPLNGTKRGSNRSPLTNKESG